MRAVPLILVASPVTSTGDELAAQLRQHGSLVYVTRSAEGCLRVATSVGPDVVLLDPALPSRLEKLLHAHPTSRRAQIMHLDDPRSVRWVARATSSPSVPVGPRAA